MLLITSCWKYIDTFYLVFYGLLYNPHQKTKKKYKSKIEKERELDKMKKKESIFIKFYDGHFDYVSEGLMEWGKKWWRKSGNNIKYYIA